MEPLPQKVLVLGLARSGEAVARYLAHEREEGADVSFAVLDENAGSELQERAGAVAAETGAQVALGVSKVAGQWDLVVASPGIPPHSELMRSASELGVEIVSELEFAYRRSEGTWAAVTGTNGKTTTTALLAHLLNVAGMPAEAVGNIGFPAISAVKQAGEATLLVAEASSFQLAKADRFHPRVALLLNITPDHADWHGSLEAYEADKGRVFANMVEGDTAVIDVDDPGSAPWAMRVESAGVDVCRVSLGSLHPGGAALVDGVLTLDAPDGPIGLVDAGRLRILGTHNVSNALAAAAAAHALAAPVEAIRAGLCLFEPIEHRLEPVAAVAGVEYCNDSKATNPDAVCKALTAFEGRPVIALLGGRSKVEDFSPLARAVAGTCRLAVIYGEALPQLRRGFESTEVEVVETRGLADAVRAAVDRAEPGDVVLLSPACKSFDEFRSYEHRGDVFKALVAELGSASSGEAPAARPARFEEESR